MAETPRTARARKIQEDVEKDGRSLAEEALAAVGATRVKVDKIRSGAGCEFVVLCPKGCGAANARSRCRPK